jgi:hypothetical protein
MSSAFARGNGKGRAELAPLLRLKTKMMCENPSMPSVGQFDVAKRNRLVTRFWYANSSGYASPIDQSPAAHLTFHDREHFSAIVNTAPRRALDCSRSNVNLFTLPWNPCSRSRGNSVHHRVEYAKEDGCPFCMRFELVFATDGNSCIVSTRGAAL